MSIKTLGRICSTPLKPLTLKLQALPLQAWLTKQTQLLLKWPKSFLSIGKIAHKRSLILKKSSKIKRRWPCKICSYNNKIRFYSINLCWFKRDKWKVKSSPISMLEEAHNTNNPSSQNLSHKTRRRLCNYWAIWWIRELVGKRQLSCRTDTDKLFNTLKISASFIFFLMSQGATKQSNKDSHVWVFVVLNGDGAICWLIPPAIGWHLYYCGSCVRCGLLDHYSLHDVLKVSVMAGKNLHAFLIGLRYPGCHVCLIIVLASKHFLTNSVENLFAFTFDVAENNAIRGHFSIWIN